MDPPRNFARHAIWKHKRCQIELWDVIFDTIDFADYCRYAVFCLLRIGTDIYETSMINNVDRSCFSIDTIDFDFADYRRYAVFCLLRIGTDIYETSMLNSVDRSMTDLTFDDILVL